MRAASAALATAAFTSALLARSTSAVCAPVAGLNTGAARPDTPGWDWLSIQCEIRVVMAPTVRDRTRRFKLFIAMLQKWMTR